MDEEKLDALIRLYRTNADLFQRLAELMDQSGRQWSDRQKQNIATAIADTDAELKELLAATDAAAFVGVQPRIVHRHLAGRQRAMQDTFQSIASWTTMNSQFAAAFRDWYLAVAEVSTDAASFARVASPWAAYVARFQQFWPPSSDGTAGHKQARGK